MLSHIHAEVTFAGVALRQLLVAILPLPHLEQPKRACPDEDINQRWKATRLEIIEDSRQVVPIADGQSAAKPGEIVAMAKKYGCLVLDVQNIRAMARKVNKNKRTRPIETDDQLSKQIEDDYYGDV